VRRRERYRNEEEQALRSDVLHGTAMELPKINHAEIIDCAELNLNETVKLRLVKSSFALSKSPHYDATPMPLALTACLRVVQERSVWPHKTSAGPHLSQRHFTSVSSIDMGEISGTDSGSYRKWK
jgi:hypothetical protein